MIDTICLSAISAQQIKQRSSVDGMNTVSYFTKCTDLSDFQVIEFHRLASQTFVSIGGIFFNNMGQSWLFFAVIIVIRIWKELIF